MRDLKHYTPPKILWIDLEMTGLAPATDRIIEVAAIVTDWQFNELETLESGVGHEAGVVERLTANEFYAAHPQNRQELVALSAQSPSSTEVESKLLALVGRHFGPQDVALLAGNSIHTDRSFIRQWWPRLEQRLHYRMLDVTAWKVVMAGRFKEEFAKQESHRALDDIRESIAELQYYLTWFGGGDADT